jgi:mono/diheme cytochrome c family protein
MRRAARWLGLSMLASAGLAAAAAGYVFLRFPIIEPVAEQSILMTDEKRSRGAYLAEHVAVCVDCHSERDFSRFSGPSKPGTSGQGGERFGHDIGVPGELFATNITPYALGSWSDGELARAITSGVTPDGRALFPIMNYPGYAKLCQSDLEALVTYVRELEPIAHDTPASSLDFPVNLIVRTLPRPAPRVDTCPDPADTKAQGKYLVTVAGCADCHTPRRGPDPIAELAFAGGSKMPLPSGGSVQVKNITPDASGIGGWSREAFVARFAAFRDPASLHPVEQNAFNTPMPWSMYAGMSDQDLGAIYDYLRTLPPVRTESAAVAIR